MTTYLSELVLEDAKREQRKHDVAEGGWWCRACHRTGRGKIAAGRCEEYENAEALIQRFRRPQARASRPPSRPVGGRFWP